MHMKMMKTLSLKFALKVTLPVLKENVKTWEHDSDHYLWVRHR